MPPKKRRRIVSLGTADASTSNLCRRITQRVYQRKGTYNTAAAAAQLRSTARFRDGFRCLRTFEANCQHDHLDVENTSRNNSNTSYDASTSGGNRGHQATANLECLRERSPIAEIIVTEGGLIFALTKLGAAPVFDSTTGRRICYLNTTPDETVRSLFYNKVNESIITVSVFKKDQYRELRCRSTPLSYVWRGKPEIGFPCFISEELRYPGFVEFDAVNQRVLTFAANRHEYKVWDLLNYSCLFAIADKSISETKISPGALLVVYRATKDGEHLPLKVLSLKDEGGDVMFEKYVKLEPGVIFLCPEFMEYSEGKLFFKQIGGPLKIVDLSTSGAENVLQRFEGHNSFLFLNEIRRFLIFHGGVVTVWNFKGDQVCELDSVKLLHQDNMSCVFISSAQDAMISYCGNSDPNHFPFSINVSDLRTGKLLSKISARSNCTNSSALGKNSENSEITNHENGVRHRGEVQSNGSERQDNADDGRSIARSVLVDNLAAEASAQIAAQSNTQSENLSDEASSDENTSGPSSVNMEEPSTAKPAGSIADQQVRGNGTAGMRWQNENRAGLQKVTCVAFDEVSCEIVTGNAMGQIMIWGH